MDVTLKQVNPTNAIKNLQFEYYPPIYVTMPNGHFSSTFDTDMLPHIYIYTGCPRRNVKYFGRVFLMLNYTDITQNTYIQS